MILLIVGSRLTRPTDFIMAFRLLQWLFLLAFLMVGCSRTGPVEKTEDAERAQSAAAQPQSDDRSDSLPSAVAATETKWVGPLASAYARIDPLKDGWLSEAASEAAARQLKRLGKMLEKPSDDQLATASELATADFACPPLRPDAMDHVMRDDSFTVLRAPDPIRLVAQLRGAQGLVDAIRPLRERLGPAPRVKYKIIGIETAQASIDTTVMFQASSSNDDGAIQVNAVWNCRWSNADPKAPRLASIKIREHEETQYRSDHGAMFVDVTESALGKNACYREQLLRGTDHWRSRIIRAFGQEPAGLYGLAIGDANGDDLDDVYLCQHAGLPNRLLIRNHDGTLTDRSRESGTDWLEYSTSALFVDLDDDSDQDLVVGQRGRVLIMANDGRGRFRVVFGRDSPGDLTAMAAADFDADGDLDLYLCCYNPLGSVYRAGAMAAPLPIHDANNGAANVLLRNLGQMKFADATKEVGLEKNNRRFSYAASWEDYDNDGDQDLYVANDFGRNCLYRNDGGRFTDVAAEVGVQDMAAGMSASWGDFNNDGHMDLYVSNMFSSAGNRIAYQRAFQSKTSDKVKSQFQRHARGNTLFQNAGNGRFQDVSETAGVTMGRWAWGSKFVDLNNDGAEDLVVANGFISAPDSGDL